MVLAVRYQFNFSPLIRSVERKHFPVQRITDENLPEGPRVT